MHQKWTFFIYRNGAKTQRGAEIHQLRGTSCLLCVTSCNKKCCTIKQSYTMNVSKFIRQFLSFLLILILFFTFTNSSSAQTGAVTFVHDPCIIKAGEYYYIFSTGDRIEMRRSKDLQNWVRLNQVFQSIPEWG